MSTTNERIYIVRRLMPELARSFEEWAKEYKQERDLGKRGEFVSLYRKVRKLKTLVWDRDHARTPLKWREDERTIIKEVVAHGLLMLLDYDKETHEFDKWMDSDDEDEPFDGFTRRQSPAEARLLALDDQDDDLDDRAALARKDRQKEKPT